MFRNLRFNNTCLFFILGWVPLLGACTQPMDAIVSTAAASDESILNTNKGPVPIDATVPEVFETASFGLG